MTATASKSYLAKRLATSFSLADGRKVGSSLFIQSPLYALEALEEGGGG